MKTFSSLSELKKAIKEIEKKNETFFDIEVVDVQNYDGGNFDLDVYREEGALYFLDIWGDYESNVELYLYPDGHVEIVSFDTLLKEMFDEFVEVDEPEETIENSPLVGEEFLLGGEIEDAGLSEDGTSLYVHTMQKAYGDGYTQHYYAEAGKERDSFEKEIIKRAQQLCGKKVNRVEWMREGD